MPRNIKLTIAYDGTRYAGWQIQPGKETIQGILTRILEKILQHKVTLIGASRTDAGVHALGQVAHFHTESSITGFKLLGALNGLLPEDIAVQAVQEVAPQFHARKLAKKKTYRYLILNSAIRNPLWITRARHAGNPLKIKEMRQGARCLVGRHDFRAFQGRKAATKTSVRTIESIVIGSCRGDPCDRPGADRMGRIQDSPLRTSKMIGITITGNGFLKQMVRNIVGLLLEVGEGRRSPSDVKKVLASRDRTQAGACAPACGLYLIQVDY